MDYEEEYEEIIEEKKEQKKSVDYKKKYEERLKEEEEQSNLNRIKRAQKNKKKELEKQIFLESLKDHSTGLIIWKKNKNSELWEGYVKEKKHFQIKTGIFKHTLSLNKDIVVKEENKKDKNLKTSFEIFKLQLIAEEITKRLYNIKK